MATTSTIIEGKYNKAFIYAADIEAELSRQISTFLNHEAFVDSHIAIMPDVHAGKGAVIGFTGTLGDRVIPNVIGVDIGCGVKSWCIGPTKIDYQYLDNFIRGSIPFGRSIRHKPYPQIENVIKNSFSELSLPAFLKQIRTICSDQNQDHDRVLCSLGSLGGGNHFIELDKDNHDNTWLTIHSGSRNFGLRIAEYHQSVARKRCGSMGGLEYLEGADKNDYLEQMKIAQHYAQINRQIMGETIIKDFFNLMVDQLRSIESIHNYISFKDSVIRKGAISAHKNEPVIIPFNMADGIIIGQGLGNPDWNFSAPHGAGRQMSRTAARKHLSVDEFKSRMTDVWSSCVGKSTIDESPMAYKPTQLVSDYLHETIKIEQKLRPIYNFKAED